MFLLGIILIIAYVAVAEFIALLLNRSIVRDANMMANPYMFNVRYTRFNIFFNIIMGISLIAFAYFFITGSGNLDGRSITAIILLIFTISELVRMLFFKVKINSNSIDFRGLIKRDNITFDDIEKVEVMKLFGLFIADISSNNKKVFTLINTMEGYSIFINRLKTEDGVEWVNILGNPLNKSDI